MPGAVSGDVDVEEFMSVPEYWWRQVHAAEILPKDFEQTLTG
jgi:hypothetical protein